MYVSSEADPARTTVADPLGGSYVKLYYIHQIYIYIYIYDFIYIYIYRDR